MSLCDAYGTHDRDLTRMRSRVSRGWERTGGRLLGYPRGRYYRGMLDRGSESTAGIALRRLIRWKPRSPRQRWLVVATVAVIMGVAYLIAWGAGGHPLLFFFAETPCIFALALVLNSPSRASQRKERDIGDQSAAAHLAAGVPEEVVHLVQQGKEIQAIKQYRTLNPGTGLKEAKDIIDGL